MKVTLQPSGHIIELLPGERIIDAVRRLGFDAPQSCRNGNCHICAANLISGRVLQHGTERSRGELFTCIAEPLEDCEVEWQGVLAPDELPLRQLACQVTDIEDVGGDVCRVLLRTPAGKPLRYHAGQYLLLERPDGELSAFSIASAPHEERLLELHILTREPSTRELVEHLRTQRLARVRAPLGDCCLPRVPERPLVMIAAGTGLAQMQSMAQFCLHQGFSLPLHLYWGVRHPDDFYRAPHWQQWQQEPQVYLHQVVSDTPEWEGRQGMLCEAVCEDLTSLADYEIYLCGSPPMVYATLDALLAAGAVQEQVHSDVFAYAPRDGV